MAFTRTTRKQHGTSRRTTARRGAQLAGMAGLATAGVVGSLASPAAAASAPAAQAGAHGTGLSQAAVAGDRIADSIAVQADAQRSAAAETEARKEAAEAREAAAEAARERAERERAERAAERAALNGYVAPVEAPSIATSYGSSGGAWSSGSHTGVDFDASPGTAVQAVAAGEVVEAGWDGSYGNAVVIRHDDGRYTQYGHMSSVSVSPGQSVGAGEQVGLSGATGNTTGPHLHFEVRTRAEYGSDVAPLAYLREHGVEV